MALTRSLLCPAPSPCTRLSRAPSTIRESDSPCGACLRQGGPFRWHPRRSAGRQRSRDRLGYPRFLGASLSARAMLSDPAGVSGSHRPCRLPTLAFQLFDTVGLRTIVTRLNRFTCVTARASLCLRLAHVVTFMSPRLDSRWGGSSPFRGGNFTRWKRQAYPGAPKNDSMSISNTVPPRICINPVRRCLRASWAERPGRNPNEQSKKSCS